MGERSAVRPKSGQSVCESDPGLRRPTPPETAGRKPAARPPNTAEVPGKEEDCVAALPQPKIRRGAGWNPAGLPQREALGHTDDLGAQSSSDALDDSQTSLLIEFFQVLDRWDREAHGHATM